MILFNHYVRICSSLVLVIILSFILSSCNSSNKTQTVTLAGTASLLNSLVWIAHEKGYFKAQGLDINFKVYPTGKRSLMGMLAGDTDICSTSDIPFMAKLSQYPDLRIIATLGSSDDELKIVTRTDRGIKTPEDLQGKVIGTQKASAVHFFLHLFLLQYYIPEDDVKIVFMKAEDLPVALANGTIDAMSMREPMITRANELLSGNIQVFSEPALYRKTYNLVSRESYIKQHPQVITKMLKALLKSEQFVETHPEEAKKIMVKRLNTDPASVDRLWNNFVLKIVLEQDLLLQLQLQEKWVKQFYSKDGPVSLPIFQSLNLEPLSKVAPERVGLKPVTASPVQ